MESWMCNSRGKGLTLPDGIIPYAEDMTRIKGTPSKRELEGSFNNDGTILFSSQDVSESLRHVEGCAGITQKSFSGSVVELFGKGTTRLQVTNASHSFNQKATSGEKEAGSKNSSSVIDSDAKESTTIDLKLGRFSDCGYSKKCNSIGDAKSFKSFASPIPAKRIRSTSLNVQTPFCQVLNCNMDLSALKDYYKRHKVCEIHSKTSVVIVNGIEQRFCQQCSRFHLLDAFDAGKRSCRKRLAGHNERRRKPQIDINPARTGRMTQPYHDMLSCGMLQGANYENGCWQGQAQSREGALSSNGPSTATVGQLYPRSLNTAIGTQKHFPPNLINAINPDGVHVNNGNQYEVGFGALTFVVDDELHNRSLPVVSSVPTCAHSLLSSRPQRSYLHPCDVSASGQPLLSQDGNVQCGKVPYLGKALAVESQASTSIIPCNCDLWRMNSLQDEHISLMASYTHNTAEGFDVHNGGNFQGSRFMTTKDNLADESGHTIDLLQLSSLLQNAEERRSVEVKQVSAHFKSFPNI